MSVKSSVPEVIHRFDTSNGSSSYNNLKIILLNEETIEEEAKKHIAEGAYDVKY